MKKLTFLLVFISIVGYSQTPILPSIQERLPQDLVEKMKPMNLEFGDGEMMNFNPNQKNNKINSQSFERKLIVKGDISYRLDSIVEIYFNVNGLNSRYEYSYDENGNQTLYIQYRWNSESQSFVPSMKNESSFDENGNGTHSVSYNWNSESQSFFPSGKEENTFDENGNQTQSVSYNWDLVSQSFVPSRKNEYTFDENGNQTQSILYNWDLVSQSFVPSRKEEKTYDENNFTTKKIYYSWYPRCTSARCCRFRW